MFRLVKERFDAEPSGVEFVDHEVFGDIHQFGGLNGRLLSKSEAEAAAANR